MKKFLYNALTLSVATNTILAADHQQRNQPRNQHSQMAAVQSAPVVGYPDEWNNYNFNKMFDLLKNYDFNQKFDSLKDKDDYARIFLCHWMNALTACFDIFDNDRDEYKAKNYTKTIYTLGTHLKGRNYDRNTVIPFIRRWSQRSPFGMFNAQDIANSLWALATLGVDKTVVPVSLLKAITSENITTFNAQNIANSLSALATLRVDKKDVPTALLNAITSEKITTFKSQEIANSLWAFAKLGIDKKDVPISLLKAITSENIKVFNAQEIANSLWALAKLGIDKKDVPISLLKAITSKNITTFNAQNISNSLWALATLGVDKKDVPTVLLRAITDKNIKMFNAQDIANSFWALAALGVDKTVVPDALLKAITSENIRTFNVQDIANSLWALATLGVHKTVLPDALLKAITSEIRTFNSQDIANSLWALATLGVNKTVIPAALLKAITPENIKTFKSQGIANSLWALATLGIDKKDFPADLLKAITDKNIIKFTSQEIANILWVLAVLDINDHPSLEALFNSGKNFNIIGQHQRHIAAQSFGRSLTIDLTPFKGILQTVSQSEIKVFNTFKKDFSEIKAQHFIQETASYVDLYLESQKIVIQVDGPTHYFEDGSLKPEDILKDKILRKNGYTVHRIKLGSASDQEISRVKGAILQAIGNTSVLEKTEEEKLVDLKSEHADPQPEQTPQPASSIGPKIQKQSKKKPSKNDGWKTVPVRKK